MNSSDRLECFEKMLSAIQSKYDDGIQKMSELKAAGKEKTATYRQLFGEKLKLGDMLAMYRLYGLIK